MKTVLQNELLAFFAKEGKIDEGKAKEYEEGKSAKKTVDDFLLKEGGISEEALAQAKARLAGISSIDLTLQEIDPKVLNLIPQNVALNYQAIAFGKDRSTLKVALIDPRNYQAMQAVEFLAGEEGLSVKYFVSSATGFRSAYQKYELLRREVAEVLEAAKEKLAPEEKGEMEEGVSLEEVIKGAPVSRIVAVIMRHAFEGKASDIHIEPAINESRVRYRVDGVLRTALTLPATLHSAVVARIKVLANLRIDETRIPQDGRISETFGGKDIDFRISVLPLREGQEKVVMRILDASLGVPTLEQLGFHPEHVSVIGKNIKRPHGLILISGPTGSGKSTTLYTVLNMINADGVNISTLEDPVEYFIKGVNQSQIHQEVGFTFAAGLRALLRQDPNIIMVGEIRDSETATLAIHAALTGHLILSTVHTNDALGVVPRLLDMGVEPFLLAATLNVAIAQRLARKICSDCKAPAEIPEKVLAEAKKEIEMIPVRYLPEIHQAGSVPIFYKGKGCPRCGGSGYRGRVAVAEILQVTRELSRVIAAGFELAQARKEAEAQEMITLRQDTLIKALQGFTTVEEVLRVSEE
ncbi:MAG: GspE/PulE family protein [Patescibacteria group bacterium]